MQKIKFPESERLSFSNWKASDMEALYRLNSDPAVMEYFPKLSTKEEAAAYITKLTDHFEEYGFTYYKVVLKKSDSFVGFIGLKWVKNDIPLAPFVDIGWRLLPDFWGRGLATEGAKACLAFAFSELQLSEVYSLAPLVNKPSIAVMKKIGMQYLESFDHPLLTDYPELQRCALYQSIKSQTSAG